MTTRNLGNLTKEEVDCLLSEGLDPNNWTTSRVLADYWGVTPQTISKARRNGEYVGSILIGIRYFYPLPESLEMWEPNVEDEKVEIELKKNLGRTDLESLKRLPQHKRMQATYLNAMGEYVTIEDWLYVVERALQDAKDGDRHARKWLSDYLIGTPIRRSETTNVTEVRFTKNQRAAAIEALLGGEVVDVDARESGGTDSHSEEVSG